MTTQAADPDEHFSPSSCAVVEGIYCLAPANTGRADDAKTRARCFSCGEAVCINCSLRIRYYDYGVRRICHNCIRERFGEYDPRIYVHLWTLAGYMAAEGRKAAADDALVSTHKTLGPPLTLR